jgi:hypothetical protein
MQRSSSSSLTRSRAIESNSADITGEGFSEPALRIRDDVRLRSF